MTVKIIIMFILLVAVYVWTIYEMKQAPDEDEGNEKSK